VIESWLGSLKSCGDFKFSALRVELIDHAFTIGIKESDLDLPIDGQRSLSAYLRLAAGSRVSYEKRTKMFTIGPPSGQCSLKKLDVEKLLAPNLAVSDKRTISALRASEEKLKQENASLVEKLRIFQMRFDALERMMTENPTTPMSGKNSGNASESCCTSDSASCGSSTDSFPTPLSSMSSRSGGNSSMKEFSTSTPDESPRSSLNENDLLSSIFDHGVEISDRYRMALRECYVLSGVSMEKLPRLIVLCVWESIVELRRLHMLREVSSRELRLEDIVRMVPCRSSFGAHFDQCQKLDDQKLSTIVGESTQEVFSVTDGGNQGSTKLIFQKQRVLTTKRVVFSHFFFHARRLKEAAQQSRGLCEKMEIESASKCGVDAR
jgi:hypothetical protein